LPKLLPKSKIKVFIFGELVFTLNQVDIDNPFVVETIAAGSCGNCKYCKLDEFIRREPFGTL